MKNETRYRIAVLLDHPGRGDTRVLATLRALDRSGHQVRLFTLNRINRSRDAKTISTPDELAELDICTLILENRLIVPGWQRLAEALGRGNTENEDALPLPIATLESTEAPLSADKAPLSLVGRINATLGALFWHRAVAKITLPSVMAFDPDLVISNDLSMLGAGIAVARASQAPLIYDAHEYEAGRNGISNSVSEAIRQSFEPRLVREATQVVTVSAAIATQLQQDHHALSRIHVIPNSAPVAGLSTEQDQTTDQAWRASLSLPADQVLALYVGSAALGRGLEQMLESLIHVPAVHLAYLGHIDPSRLAALDALAVEHDVANRWHVTPPVSPDKVGAIIAAADLCVIPIQPSCTSYRLSLPNKLFQALSVGTPVLSTPLPEISAVLAHFGGGQTTPGFDAQALAQGLRDWLTSRGSTLVDALDSNKIDRPDMLAYSRSASDARWVSLVDRTLENPTRHNSFELAPLPHAEEVTSWMSTRPSHEIVPSGWRRAVGRALVWLTAIWTHP